MTEILQHFRQPAQTAGRSAADGLAELLYAAELAVAWPSCSQPGLIAFAGRWRNRLAALRGRLQPDWFILSLIGTVAAASLLPCHGLAARVFQVLGMAAISALFFLQGARLPRETIVASITHWRLHLAITAATFVLFPTLGLGLIGLSGHQLASALRIGILFVCVLPSTVQSSVALTSIARGNVAGAVCAASASNLIGMLLTPLMLGALLRLRGVTVDPAGFLKIVLELFVPFVTGHLLRPWIGNWADRNRALLSVTDRGSILLVVYAAFSAAVIHGVWQSLPVPTLAVIVLADALLLGAALTIMTSLSRLCGMRHADEVAIVFCGSQKSLVSAVPIASVIFTAHSAGVILLPIMIYYQLQLVVSAWLARRYAAAASAAGASGEQAGLQPARRGPRPAPVHLRLRGDDRLPPAG